MIEYLTITIPCSPPEYRFEIVLSEEVLQSMSRETLFGITFQKEKYRFLSDLADVLAAEILKELEKIER